MTKYIKNLLKLTLIVGLFVACSLTGRARIESSVKDITDEIKKARKEAQDKGLEFDNFKEGKTGAKMGGGAIVKAAKIRVIELSEKFIKAIEEEAMALKESVGEDKDQLLKDMYDFMLKAAKELENFGLQGMTKTVIDANIETPATTVDGTLAIAGKIKVKLKSIKDKQVIRQPAKQ
ncbi:decorin-binding protein DbpA [Borreliella bavariensis]|uniref:decorin-binding protein DbpA n=1 Tax=Borreliella bavariensis TaxID=664662 RepID=UPI001C00F579|nr:decorin-binding protein DbpA [Borreliella bavariensis]